MSNSCYTPRKRYFIYPGGWSGTAYKFIEGNAVYTVNKDGVVNLSMSSVEEVERKVSVGIWEEVIEEEAVKYLDPEEGSCDYDNDIDNE
jgi:hypothetical protein